MNDKKVLDICFGVRQINAKILRQLNSGHSDTKELSAYLKTRYPDFKSYQETLYRIKYNIETLPTCEECG